MTPLKDALLKAGEKQKFLDVIDEWQTFWMNQTQNNEQDRQNYWRRAFGVDANMRHHLARMLSEEMLPLLEACAEVVEALEEVLEKGNMATLGKWDATDEMKAVAYAALVSLREHLEVNE